MEMKWRKLNLQSSTATLVRNVQAKRLCFLLFRSLNSQCLIVSMCVLACEIHTLSVVKL